MDIQKLAIKSYIHSFWSRCNKNAVSLLKSGEQCHVRALNICTKNIGSWCNRHMYHTCQPYAWQQRKNWQTQNLNFQLDYKYKQTQQQLQVLYISFSFITLISISAKMLHRLMSPLKKRDYIYMYNSVTVFDCIINTYKSITICPKTLNRTVHSHVETPNPVDQFMLHVHVLTDHFPQTHKGFTLIPLVPQKSRHTLFQITFCPELASCLLYYSFCSPSDISQILCTVKCLWNVCIQRSGVQPSYLQYEVLRQNLEGYHTSFFVQNTSNKNTV